MRQQEGIHDDHEHVQLNSCDDEEVNDEGARHKEVDYNYEEVFDKEEDGRRGFAVCLTDSYSLTATFLAVGLTSRRGHLIEGRPR